MLIVSSLLTRLPLARLVVRVTARVAKMDRTVRNRLAVRRLRQLDDHGLKDIGLTRADVDGALAAPLWQDPSRILADHAGTGAGHVARARALGVRRGVVTAPGISAVNA
jgi:uncharacterized protein YjiS (DUF1127 family)